MRDSTHTEHHFSGGPLLRDLIIGMSDGLTVPFALAAGLSGAVAASSLVATAGVAEVAAGSIAMGLGGYLATRSDADHFLAEQAREFREVEEKPDAEVAEVEEILGEYGVSPAEAAPLIAALKRNPQQWVRFMMRFELGLEQPDPRRAIRSAFAIGGAYVVGGMIPLAPYFLVDTTAAALLPSAALTGVALLIFGAIKGRFTTGQMLKGALQTLLIGGLAASAAFSLAKLLD